MAVFISYRRDDASKASKRLAEAFRDRLGYDHVFHDVSSIDAGENWRRRIDKQLKTTRLFICVIGPSWASSFADREAKKDIVFYEVAKALKARRRVQIIPVLVGDTDFPSKADLPRRLRKLAEYNAFLVAKKKNARDLDRLMSKAAEYFPKLEEQAAAEAIKRCLEDALTRFAGQVENARQRLYAAIDKDYAVIKESAWMSELWELGRSSGEQAVREIGELPFRIRPLQSGEVAKINAALHVPKSMYGTSGYMKDKVTGLVRKTIDSEKTVMRYIGGAGTGTAAGGAAGTMVPGVGNIVGGLVGGLTGAFAANAEADSDIRKTLKREMGYYYRDILDHVEELRGDPAWTSLVEDLARGRIR
ncbi:MAG: toll/interleukin-1 receptor domain-containing protein [Pseudomonadota bacterium]